MPENGGAQLSRAEGPAAGLALLDAAGADPRLARWPQLHIARAELLRRLGRAGGAAAAYHAAPETAPAEPEREFIRARLRELTAPHVPGPEGEHARDNHP